MKLLFCNCDILASDGAGFRVIRNGYLGVGGDTIDYIGTDRPAARYDAEKDMRGKALIPGLVNAHTHAAMCLLRGVGSDLPLQQWLFDKIFPIENRLTADDIEAGTNLALLEMLACGTTSFSDMYFQVPRTAEAVLKAGMKANLCRPLQSFDPHERPEDNFRVGEALELYDGYNGAGNGRILVDFSIHAEYTCTQPLAEYAGKLCSERRGNMHVHLSETKKEHEECIARWGKTPAAWFRDAGDFDSGAFAAHCVAVTDDDLRIFREKGVSVIHNPTSNMKLGSGFAPVQKMLDMGLNVGLGTDGAASNNNLNLFEEMHLAAVIHNGYTGDPTILKPADVLRMATLGGARAQRRADTGELRVGKKADIAAVDLSAPHLTPDFDLPALLVYSAQGSDVCMTMVNGKILYENGEYTTLDRERVLTQVNAAVKRLYA